MLTKLWLDTLFKVESWWKFIFYKFMRIHRGTWSQSESGDITCWDTYANDYAYISLGKIHSDN